MVNVDDFNNTKSLVISILKSYNLNDQKINEMVTDEFIRGFLILEQQEPENNQFLNLARNFPTETNLNDIEILDKSFRNEIISGGYFCDILQYVVDSWRNIDLSQTPLSRSMAEDIGKGKIAGSVALGLAGVPAPARGILGSIASYVQIAVGAYEQEEKVQNILDRMDEELWRIATGAHNIVKTAETVRSPLIIDLDGDGIETVSSDKGVYFDHDGNSLAEKSGWVGKDDGLLVRDINGNGQIDDGTELFGNNSVLSNGQKAANGFEALKDLDSNNNGTFDSSDTAWNQVKVWKDSNKNGVVDNGELLSLEQAGIENIDLNYQNSNAVDANGNTVGQIGTFDKENGTQGNISDIWFNTDLMDTVDRTNIEIPADIAALPNVLGFGNVHDLHTAMALDTSGELKALVQQYAIETDSEARQQILYNIIYHWTGVQDMDPNGRDPTQVYGKVIDDTRKLEALEEFMGKEYLGTWCWGERDPNPHGKAAPYILRAFDILAGYINNELLAQTHYKPLLENVKLIWDNTTETWSVDVSGAVAQIQSLYNENAENGIITFREFERLVKSCGYDNLQSIYEAFRTYGSLTGSDLDTMFAKFGYTYGTDLNDDLTGTAGVDEINGLAGNDSIYGGVDNDTLDGGTGNDNIFGEDGDDILIGGEGNDYLIGGNGADTYIFNPGFSNDAIDNSDDNASASEPDIIQFGEGILASNTTLGRQGYDLIITVSYDPDENGTTRPNDSIRVYSYFDQQGTSSATIDAITFADGTSWDYEYVINHWNSVPGVDGGETLEGNNENNTINGTNYNDILIGNGGNDTINAGNGNDRLLGGTGNDSLNGGSGDDTYLWNWGDGMDTISDTGNHDKISFGDGITYSDLKFRQEGGNLRITVKNNENQGLLLNSFFSGLNYKIEDLYFQDGSIIHLSEIPLTLHQLNTDETINLTGNGDTVYANGGNDTINGGQGNDFIYGGNGDDTISGGYGMDIIAGGKGNDTINGNGDADTYIWNLGDDLDTITASNIDKIQFGEGITEDSLTFRCEGNNLRIIVNNDETQGIILVNFFYDTNYKLNNVQFADGSTLNLAVTGLTFDQHFSRGDTITGTSFDDIINAQNTYSVTINAGDGSDTINAGEGNDTINAGNGNNIIKGSKGNDSLNAGSGDDTYIWNLGDGYDTIYDSNGNDKIVFGTEITPEDLTFTQNGNNLVITMKGDSSQGIEIINYYNSHPLEELHFADGTVKLLPQMDITLVQGNHNETINGTDSNETIYGNGGNDTINGNYGNDILIGGTGNDTLNGGGDNDTYVYNLGDGLDTITDDAGSNKIIFGEGITQNNLTFTQMGNNLLIYLNGDKNQGIMINNFFYNDSYKIGEIHFADNSVFYLSETGLTLDQSDRTDNMTINGTDYDDTIIGGSGNDTINAGDDDDVITGGKGNDILNGGYGRDTYIYNLGDGVDTINETRGNDKIKFGAGITLNDLKFTQEGNDLRIIIKNDVNQNILIKSFYNNVNYQVETLVFADGTTFNLSTQGLTLQQTNADEAIKGTSYNDIIYGNGGHDTINAGEGNDTLIGGIGNDILNGGNGDDTYIYNLGDGFDTISESGGDDKIVFGEGINQSDLSFEKIGNNLKISINGDEIKGIQINDHFRYDSSKVETIEFHDGSTLDISNADQLIQAMNSFSLSNSASMDTLSNPTQDVSDMYSLAASQDLTRKAI